MATPYIYVNNVIVDEDDGTINFVIRLSSASASSVTVNYGFDEAQAGEYDTYYDANYSDFNGFSGTLSFSAGETSKTVTYNLWNDGVAESIESFRFILNSPTNAIIATNTAQAIIFDNDSVASGNPNLRVDDVYVDESAGIARFTVRLDQASSGSVSVNYATQNVSATAGVGNDYTAASGTLTFSAGELVKTVEVNVNNDTTAEGDEYFNLNLSNVSGANIVDGTGTALIGRNDGAAVASPYVFSEDVTLSEDATYVDFRVQLSQQSSNQVTVNYNFSELTAGEYSTYYDQHYSDFQGYSGSLVFAPGETLKTVRYHIYNDNAAEQTEAFMLNLSVPSGGNAIVSKQYAYATLVDNDQVVSTGLQPNLTVDDVIVNESDGHATFTVRLDKASTEAVTLNYATANVSATSGSDYTAVSGGLTFAPYEMVKTVTVEIANDTSAEGDELLNLNLSNVVGAGVTDGTGTATISRNDGAAVAAPYIAVEDVMIGEDAAYVEFRVQLNQASFNQVSVNYNFLELLAGEYDSYYDANYSDFKGYSGTLVFAAGETAKTVRYDLYDDSTVEQFNGFLLKLSSPTNGIISKAEGYATLVDNDKVADTGTQPNLVVDDVIVNESDGHATFTVRLDKASTEAVTVDYATANVSATAGSDYTALSGGLTFAPYEMVKTVTVEIANDTSAEGDELLNLNLSNVVGAGVTDGTGTATISRNDGAAVAAPYIAVEDVMIGEDAPYVEFRVQLNQASFNQVSVNYNFYELNAGEYDSYYNADYSDFKGYSGGLVFAAGETEKTVRFDLYDDSKVESFDGFLLTLSSPTNGILSKAFGYATLIDNDKVADTGTQPNLVVDDVIVNESDGHATFTVRLDKASTEAVTVDYATANVNANAGEDFTAVSGSLKFQPGEVVKSVQVALINDATAEGEEHFDLRLSNTSGAGIADGVGTAVIGMSDGATGATPNIYVVETELPENAPYVEFIVRLDKPGSGSVSVNYNFSEGTAGEYDSYYNADYSDFDGYSGTLKFAPGETMKTVRFDIYDDGLDEADLETFQLVLSSPVGGVISNSIGVADLVDDDGAINPMAYGFAADTYIVGSTDDWVLENPAGGVDLVQSSITYTLPTYVENLTLTGDNPINGTGNSYANVMVGNGQANHLSGLAGDDTLTGGAGNDTLNGGLGVDSMTGGAGHDSYVVDNVADQVVEIAGGGIDTVVADVTYTLSAEIENLTLGGSAAIDGTGNDKNNLLQGNGANNTLDGQAGADTMKGGNGDDTYIVENAGDKVIELASSGLDLVHSSVTYTLTPNVERLILTGADAINGSGNGMANQITGNDAANSLNGAAGADTLTGGGGNDTLNGGAGVDSMIGGAGDDTYIVDKTGDKVVEDTGGGTDQVNASASYTLSANVENLVLTGAAAINGTGNGMANTITGNSAANSLKGGAGADTLTGAGGNDTLDGGGGVDSMVGGVGNDTYIVEHVNDKVVEALNNGTDIVNASVTFTLAANVENLLLTGANAINGTGNALANTLTGNGANNSLNGADGADTLLGMGGADTLLGGNGNDSLDGGGGVDSMVGGAGNDTYIVDNSGDKVVEAAGGGVDLVKATANFTLSSNVENLLLLGSGNINGTGNGLANTLTGNAGANRLAGQAGNDTLVGNGGDDTLAGGLGVDSLTGGAGLDVFLFDSAVDGVNIDTVADFSTVDDLIHLDGGIFSGLSGTGALGASSFASGTGRTGAVNSSERIVYNTTTGDLYYDADGLVSDGSGGFTEGIAPVKFAVLWNTATTHPSLAAGDFMVV